MNKGDFFYGTTNYDHLIEDVNNPNVSKYTVIKKDNELLYKTGNRYIIKMHGDIDDVKNIVLRDEIKGFRKVTGIII